MANSLPSRLPDGKRKMLSASFAPTESGGKNFSNDDAAREFGRLVARAFELANLTPQEAAYALEYANQSPISKLIHATEASPLAKLLMLPRFRMGWILSLGEGCADVRTETVLTIARRA